MNAAVSTEGAEPVTVVEISVGRIVARFPQPQRPNRRKWLNDRAYQYRRPRYVHQLPEELLDRYVSEEGFRRTAMPHRYMRGVDRPIATVSPDRTAGNAVFGRADMPDSFAYDIAKAMYEQRDLFQFGVQPLYYDSRIVWQMPDVPLHPGAAKFYREVGFIK
jgi:TRAP-type uncharacterized transport system substrate-binding protein